MFEVVHSVSNSGLSFVVRRFKTRERADVHAVKLAQQIVKSYGDRARWEYHTEKCGDQYSTGAYALVDYQRADNPQGWTGLIVYFRVYGTGADLYDSPYGELSYSRHIEG